MTGQLLDAIGYDNSRVQVPRASRIVLAAAAVLTLWVALRVVFFEGLWAADDLSYITYAARWDHPARTHLEARLLFTGLLHLAIKIFGFSPFVWATPALLGSLLMVLSAMGLAYRTQGLFAMAASGMLVASMPGDITTGTTANANPLAAGLAAVATYLLLAGRSRWNPVLAGLAGSLAILAHPVTVFYVLALACAVWLSGDRRKSFVFAAIGLGTYLAAELVLSAAVNGDPLNDFRILGRWKDVDANYTLYSLGWFLYPIQTFLLSQDYAALPILATVMAVGNWRRSPLMRVLLITLAVHWIWIGYGSAKPTTYEPLWRLTRFQYPVILALGVICGTWLARRRTVFGVVALVALNVALTASSGPYGQADDISRQFLVFTQQHPDAQFLTDNYSIGEMTLYNNIRPVSNVDSWDNTDHYLGARGRLFVLFNPLNNRWTTLPNRPGYRPPSGIPALCYGDPVMQTAVKYRMIAAWLPYAMLSKYSWLTRRPSGSVLPVTAASPCQVKLGDSVSRQF